MKATETGFLDLFNQKVHYLVPRWQRSRGVFFGVRPRVAVFCALM